MDNTNIADEEITFITNDDANTSETPEDADTIDACTIILSKLGFIGKTLANTYSEENQNSGEGFIESLRKVEDIRSTLLGLPDTTMNTLDKDSLKLLLTYLEGKLKRRVNAVDGNDVNF